MEDEQLLDSDDYYAWLGLSREATLEQINNAYRKYSRLFHPDKHAANQEVQENAQNAFTRIKKAHEVLSDPGKRAIYDTVGIKGLNTDGWQMVTREKTPAEILEEYEQLKKEEENRRLLQQTSPTGHVAVEFDATDLFDDYEFRRQMGIRSLIPTIEMSRLSADMSVMCPLTPKDTGELGSSVLVEKGEGSGTVNTSYRHVFSHNIWTEGSLCVGSPAEASVKGFMRTWPKAHVTMSGTVQLRPNGIAPSVNISVVQQLSQSIEGKLSVILTPSRAVLQTSANYNNGNVGLVFLIQLGAVNSFILLNSNYKLPDYGLTLRANAKLGTLSAAIECGCSKVITKFSTVSFGMALSWPNGVKVKLKLLRGRNTFEAVVHLSEDVMFEPILYGTVVPVLSYVFIKAFIVNPFLKDKQDKDLQKKKDANATRLAKQKAEAEATLELLKATIDKSYKTESEKNGLVITKALYGKLLADSEETTNEEELINVTNQMQSLVNNSKILLPVGTDLSQLPGFYDPCIGEDKQLAVTYQFRGQLHMCQYKEGDKILLPSQNHICTENHGDS